MMPNTILYITQDTTRTGGANKSLRLLIDGIKSQNIRVIVVCPDNKGIFQELCDQGYDVRIIRMKNCLYPEIHSFLDYILWIPRIIGRLLINTLAITKIQKICITEDVNIIHSNVSVINIGYKAAKNLHIPHFWHIREYGDIDFHLRYFPSWHQYHNNLQSSECICITHDIQKHHGFSADHSKVIYNGIQLPTIPSTKFEDKKNILYAGRVTEDKGILTLLHGYASSNSNMPLYIIGQLIPNSEIDLQIHSFIIKHNLSHKVKIFEEQGDITPFIQNAKVVVIPSHMEGFGRVLPESMALGTLTIGHNTAGTKEQLDNGLQYSGHEIGLRFLTINELASCIKKVETMDQTTYQSYTTPAKETVIALYSPTDYINSVYEYYKEIINRKK